MNNYLRLIHEENKIKKEKNKQIKKSLQNRNLRTNVKRS